VLDNRPPERPRERDDDPDLHVRHSNLLARNRNTTCWRKTGIR